MQAATQSYCDKTVKVLTMKTLIRAFFVREVLITSLLVFAAVSLRAADVQSSPIQIKNVIGHATYSVDGKTWSSLQKDSMLEHGSTIKTAADGSVDFILQYSSTVLRLTPSSELGFARLSHTPVEEVVITDTTLNLKSGYIVGSQRKLSHLSRFNIVTPDGEARIVGTEYLVRADGAVTVLSGEVTLSYNLPKNGGSVQASVAAGQSFDPSSCKVISTSSAFLKNIVSDVDSVRSNAETYKAGKCTVVVKRKEGHVSKHDCDDDDKDHGGGKDDDDRGGKGGKGGKD